VGSAGKWLLLVVMMGAAGWAAYTVKERGLLGPQISAEPTVDARLETFIGDAQMKLVAGDLVGAGEQFQKASGVNESDPRVREGLVLVDVAKAEVLWWKLSLDQHDAAAHRALALQLDAAVDRARETIANARRELTNEPLRAHLELYERRLNIFVVVAFKQIGDVERAQGALGARLASHPQLALLKAYVGAAKDGENEGSGGAQPAASASASATAAPSASAPPTQVASDPQQRDRREQHYEFNDEPTHPPKTHGELELPANTPAPTPAPDTTDLP
jgi:hypothetical protein